MYTHIPISLEIYEPRRQKSNFGKILLCLDTTLAEAAPTNKPDIGLPNTRSMNFIWVDYMQY